MMNPQLVLILLGTLLGAALGNRMRCYDCTGGPSGTCKHTVTTCSEGKPQPGLGQVKQPLSHHPACVATQHCNQVEIQSVGDVTFTTHKNCCVGDLCNGAGTSSVAPACILAAAATTLAWLLPGLWGG